ncbi:MarR family winged helix-turn-helix transcriptional regulator [Hamadaea tsunoensis]|uniref:MarR family winged helix-turn-helix transcriptional regulator n=1 Tax=Hamadaea tsunoensis TaxID=53368 RepID=UPI0004147A9D|nr:MarR family transcriptional regulator [Hamadaea tsunoensis]
MNARRITAQGRAGQAAAWRDVARTYQRVSAALDSALRQAHGISANDFELLTALAGADDGHLRMQRLAEQTGLPLSTTSRLVGRLESTGLLARYMCPDDRRGVFTQITDTGRAAFAAAGPTFAQVLAEQL